MNQEQQEKKRTHRFAWLRWVLSLFLGVLVAAGIWSRPLIASYGGLSPVSVRIPEGATSQAVKDSLETALGKDYGRGVYRVWSMLKGTPEIAHGLYVVQPQERAYRLARRIQRGRQTPVRFTFNDIRTMPELARRIAEIMECPADSFLRACAEILPDYGFSRPEQYPAAFIPDTYEFYWSAKPSKIVKKLVDARSSFWTDERRAQARTKGLTPVQVATLASIVEEETAARDERPVVARLYLNRLEKGMKLQADPTVKFATGDFSLRRITGAHLSLASPYNTYIHPGLPPGPIRIPEKASLLSVLNAPKHNYLYMCAKDDFSGRHDFAADYATHQHNAAAYRKALDRRGIK